MRHFVLAFVCFSTLAMAQNVLAIAPIPVEAETLAVESVTTMEAAVTPTPLTEMPETSTVGLLIAGLAGLTAAGSRRDSNSSGRVPLA